MNNRMGINIPIMENDCSSIRLESPGGRFEFRLTPLAIRFTPTVGRSILETNVLLSRIPMHDQIRTIIPTRVLSLRARFLLPFMPRVLVDLLLAYLI